ncbi:MAG TPA: MFS transporter [Mycobacteriales bacterium]|nr:MFS transporter [Mycobacteriales bacterium]
MSAQPSAGRGRALWTFVITGTALFMVALDNLVVTNALPSIQRDLDAGLEGLEWTVNAYTLTFAVFLLTGSALGDRYGRRRLFLAGLAVFTGASAVAALAPNITVLVAARAVQGLGAAVVTPLTLTLLAGAVPREKRGLAFGAWSAASGLAVALGPVVGGAITESASWQWIFWINVPIGVLLLPLAAWRLTESRGAGTRLDLPGTLLGTGGLLGLVLGLVRGNGHGWTSPSVLGALVGGTALLAGFLAWERRAAQPVLPLNLFANRGFAITNAVSLAMAFGMFGSIFLLSQFLQVVQGYSPLEAGVRTLPWTAMPVLAAPLAGALSDRLGPRQLLLAGLALQSAGLGWLAWAITPDVRYVAMVPGFVLAGIGMGLFFAPVARMVLGFVRPEEEGVASGASNALRQLGTVLGVAVLSAVFAAAGGYGSGQRFVDGLTPAMAVGAAVLGAAVLIGLFIPGSRRRPAAAPVPAAVPELVTA